jgi:hypothetical protein
VQVGYDAYSNGLSTYWEFKAPLLHFYTPSVDEIVYVKIMDDSLGTGQVNNGHNTYFIAEQIGGMQGPTGAQGTSTTAGLPVNNNDVANKQYTDNQLTVAKAYTDTKIAPYYPAFISGSIGAELTGTKSLIVELNQGFVANTYGVWPYAAGYYFIQAQQLISTGASAIYFNIHKNGAAIKYGFVSNALNTVDVNAATIVYLTPADYISFSVTNTLTSAWGNPHSSFQIFRVSA